MKAEGFTKESILSKGLENRGFPPFRPGDTIRVAERIKEGNKERIQYFEGDVIAVSKNGVASTFTVRRIAANSVAVEKIFPYYSPKIEGIEFVREGDVRRAKLYYMRDRIGKRARVSEKVRTHEQKMKLERRLAAGIVAEEPVKEAPMQEMVEEEVVKPVEAAPQEIEAPEKAKNSDESPEKSEETKENNKEKTDKE